MTDKQEPRSIQILQECADLQRKKSTDYQNPNSRVKQADYYPSGARTIVEILQAKILRLRSVIDAMENDPDYKPNFESLGDSFRDLINYASFGASWLEGGIKGQSENVDFINRPKKETHI